MLPPQAVVNIRQRRARRHLECLRFEASLLPQPREQSNPKGNRYRHKAILVSNKDLDFFARVQSSVDRGPSSFRGSIPERDQHIARVDEPLVAGCRLAPIRELLERSGHHLDRHALGPRRFGRRGVNPAGAPGDDRRVRRQRIHVIGDPSRLREMPATDDGNLQLAGS